MLTTDALTETKELAPRIGVSSEEEVLKRLEIPKDVDELESAILVAEITDLDGESISNL